VLEVYGEWCGVWGESWREGRRGGGEGMEERSTEETEREGELLMAVIGGGEGWWEESDWSRLWLEGKRGRY